MMHLPGRKMVVLLGVLAAALAAWGAAGGGVPPGWPLWKGDRPADDYDAGAPGERPDGRVMVPTNQILDPAGKQVFFAGRANDCALSPDGKMLAIKDRSSLKLMDTASGDMVASLRVGHTFAGLLWAPDGRTLYSGDLQGNVQVVKRGDGGKWEAGKPLPFAARAPAKASLPVGLALSADGKRLWAVLNGNNTLGEWDLAGEKAGRTIPVGRVPYGVALGPEPKAYVTNWGGRVPRAGEPSAPAPWDPIVIDPRTNSAASGTVSVVDLNAGTVTRTIEAGLHPSAILAGAGGRRIFVANTHSDTVSVIDTATDTVAEQIAVGLKDAGVFGSSPAALALAPDGKVLYVANATNNAVAVVELSATASGQPGGPAASRVLGAIPTGWYPGGLAVSADGKTLYVANVKGIGARAGREGKYSAYGYMASVSIIPVPDAKTLAGYTARVAKNNRYLRLEEAKRQPRPGAAPRPVPERIGEPSVFEHVVYIIKENRTYDNVFGDIERGNGMPALCLFGREVTPNQHKIVDEFALLDNFHCSGSISADGHQWTDEAYCADYVERSFGGFVRSYPYDGGDAMAYSPCGFIWDNCLAHGKTIRNYGEMVKAKISPKGSWKDLWADYQAGGGKYTIEASTSIDSLRPHTSPTFIGFPGTVTDAYRAGEFLKELKGFEAAGKMPNFIIMLLPNDHTMGTSPGNPTPRAQVADNDLAVGTIVEALSKSKFWPKTAVFITEDDPQAGLDHVDGHRTVGMVISAYSRLRGKVISTQYNQTSMVRTMEQILGLPPMNQLDALATPMADCFGDTPDLTPFVHAPNQVPLDDLTPAKTALTGKALHWAKVSEALPLDDVDECDEELFDRVIWHSVKGVDTPYPRLAKRAEQERERER